VRDQVDWRGTEGNQTNSSQEIFNGLKLSFMRESTTFDSGIKLLLQ